MIEDRAYFCGAHIQECVHLCDKTEGILNEDIDSTALLLRFEGPPYTDVTKCRTKSTVI
jgi:hypothetical protein